ncbi:MAG: hypothetical protein V3V00_09170 [Saprospiraceae bacterium]
MNYSKGILLVLLGISIFLFHSCGKEEALSPIPEIVFLGFSKDTMHQSFFNEDTVQMALSFIDGDGDLNNFEENKGAKIIITDLRTNALYDRFLLPDIPNNKGAVSGEMFIRLFTTCCVFPDNIPPCDIDDRYPANELTLLVILQDGKGNNSNSITTPPITLLCN